MTTLVEPQDFADWLGVELSALNGNRVDLLLELSSGLVVDELGQVVEYVEDDEVDLIGPGGDVLLLPELPVWQVLSVTIDDEELVEGTDFRLELGHDGRRGIVRRLPAGRHWPDGTAITVVYSHGYALDDADSGLSLARLPATIKALILRLTARGYTNPTGMRQEVIGRYSYTAADVGLVLSAGDLHDLGPFYPGSRSGGRK